jgi:hypothetical protein
MSADPPDQHPKNLWQSQETEADPMTLEQIHALVGKYDKRARRSLTAGAIAIGFAAFLIGTSWIRDPDTSARIALGLYLVGSTVSLILVVRALFPQRDPAESAGAYLRRRLERRLRHLQGGWMLMCAPLLPAVIAMFIVAFLHNHGPAWAPAVPVALVLFGLAVVLPVSSIRARGIKADLDELDRLMGR